MNYLLSIAVVGAWLVPLLLVVQYRRRRMPERLQEIQRTLFKTEAGKSALPAGQYVQLFDTLLEPRPRIADPAEKRKDLERVIEWQFNSYHRWSEWIPPLLLLAAASAGGLWLIYCWLTRGSTAQLPYDYGIETVLAVSGAYVWSLYEIHNRRTSRDLTPNELYSIAIRFLVAIPIGRAISIFASDAAKGSLAFAATAFPIKELLRFMRRRALKKLGEEIPADSIGRECLLGECIDGIDLATVTRLEELHITTHTNLAYVDPIRLMAQTGYSLRMIVQWMDHALLSIYAAPYKKKLKEAGLPCSLDVKEFYETHFAQVVANNGETAGWTNLEDNGCDAIKALQKKLGLDVAIIREIFQRVAADPHVLFLDTLWYNGFSVGTRPKPPACKFHIPPPGGLHLPLPAVTAREGPKAGAGQS